MSERTVDAALAESLIPTSYLGRRWGGYIHDIQHSDAITVLLYTGCLVSVRSVDADSLQRRLAHVSIENRVDCFEHVSRDIEEVAFVLDRDESPSCAVIHGNLKRLHKRSDGFDIALDRDIAKHQHSGLGWRPAKGGVCRDDERSPDFGLNLVGDEFDCLDMQVHCVHVATDPELHLFPSLEMRVPAGWTL